MLSIELLCNDGDAPALVKLMKIRSKLINYGMH